MKNGKLLSVIPKRIVSPSNNFFWWLLALMYILSRCATSFSKNISSICHKCLIWLFIGLIIFSTKLNIIISWKKIHIITHKKKTVNRAKQNYYITFKFVTLLWRYFTNFGKEHQTRRFTLMKIFLLKY